jgi:hypothetical protein
LAVFGVPLVPVDSFARPALTLVRMNAGSFSPLGAMDAAVAGLLAFSTQPVTVIAFCGRSLGVACVALTSLAELTIAPTNKN